MPSSKNASRRRKLARTLAVLVCALGLPDPAQAASQTWTGAGNDGVWSNGANWSGGAAPGAVVNVNSDIATFNGPVGTVSPITFEDQRNIASFLFDTADAGAYTFQHPSWDPTNPGLGYQGTGLFLTATANPAGNITMTSDVTSAQVFNTPIVFRLASSTNGVYSFVNNATSSSATFAFNGSLINNSANTRPLTLTLGGSNTGNNTIREIYGGDSNGTRGAFIVNKTGTGTWIITGASTTWIQKTSNGNAAGVQVNDGTLALQDGGALGSLTQGNIKVQGTGTLRLDNIFLANSGVTLNATGRLLGTGASSLNAIAIGATATNVTLATSAASDTFNVYGAITGGSASTVTHVAGPGQVLLNSAGTYVGAWSLDAGTTTLNTANALGLDASTVVGFGDNSTAILQLNGFTTTLTKLNTSATAAGTPVIENGGGGIATLVLNTASANTYAGTLRDGAGGGTLALAKNGTGSLTLSLTGANTYSGGTSINVGTLLANNTTGSATGSGPVSIANTATLGGSGAAGGLVTVNSGGTIAPGAAAGSIGTLHVGGLSLGSDSKLNYDIASSTSLDQIIVNNSGGLEINGGELTINGGSSPFTLNGVYNLIGHTGAVGGAGISALTLNANNQNLGTHSYAFGDAGGFVTLTVASSGTPPTFWNTDNSGNWRTGPWTAGTPNAVGAFAALGGGGATITANRTITVDGAYTIGTLSFNNPSFSYTLAAGAGAGITLDNGSSPAFVTVAAGNHTIQAPVALSASGAVFTASTALDSLTLSGAVSGSGALTKTGGGTLALTGANSYTGGTSINGGTLAINSGASLGDVNGAVTFAGGGIKLLADDTDLHNFQLKDLADAVIDTSGHNLTHSGSITPLSGATGGVVKNGAGALALQGSNSYFGQTTVNAGTLSINSNASLGDPGTGAALNLGAGTTLTATVSTVLDNFGSAARPVTVAAGGANIDVPDTVELTVSGSLTGGTVTKAGPGTLSVASADNTTPFVVSAGTLHSAATTSGNGGFGTGAITLQGGATLSGAMPTGNTLVFGNALTVPTGQTGNINATDRFNWTGPVTGGGTLNVNVISTQSRHDFNGDWTGFTGKLNLTGTGTARLFINGGNFDVGAEWTNTAVDLGESVTIAPVTNSFGNDIPIGALSGSSPTAILGGGSAGSPRYVVGGLNTSTTFAGQITGNASITKQGTGALTLTGTNTYTGPTTVTAGTLVLGTTAQDPIFGGATGTTPAYADVRGGKIAFKYDGDASNLVSLVSSTLDTGFDQTPQFSDGAIRSSTLAADRVLGWRNNTTDSQVEVAYTLAGDANLDFGVDFNDLVALAQNYNVTDGTRVWAQGDFTYDGSTDFNDLVKLAQNYNTALPSEAIPGASVAFEADLARAFASVPEPAGLSFLALGACLMVRRERRRRR
jgi:autotransporter-associated beta strand protein